MYNVLPDFVYAHVDGDPITAPNWELKPEHAYDEVNLPGPGSPKLKLPCAHWKLQQAAEPITLGHVPCRHLLPELHRDNSRHIVYCTAGATLQTDVARAVDRLVSLGVRMTTPLRPLRIYNRPLAPTPHDQGSDNPMWSRYDVGLHALNVHFDPDAQRQAFLDTLHHELGHATLGHRCIQVSTPGGGHNIDTASHPALALSEGWAHFVALAIRFDQSKANPAGYNGRSWEKRPAGLARSPIVESNVALALWDLYDIPNDTPAPPPGMAVIANDAVTLPFAKLFAVFSPSLVTLRDGPTIDSAGEYFDRLCALNPAQAVAIRRVQGMHFG